MAKELIKAAHLPKLLATKGKHRDGAGLFLQVAAKGQASWTYQFRFDGATHWMSIGPAATFTLTEAREAHHELRRQRDAELLQQRGLVDPLGKDLLLDLGRHRPPVVGELGPAIRRLVISGIGFNGFAGRHVPVMQVFLLPALHVSRHRVRVHDDLISRSLALFRFEALPVPLASAGL